MLGTVGGRYVLDGILGEGGMGHVYRARHVQLGKVFALKLISPAFSDDTVARERFNQEAKFASEISHPNIVSVVDFGEDPRFGAYMVMELVDGEPLVGPRFVAMSVRRACDVLGQIADALDYVHRHGIVHGDVKADNIMLSADKAGARRRQLVRLLDFGLARRPDGRREDKITGSPHYLSPERACGGGVSVTADLYALGVIGHPLVTGTLPFDGEPEAVLHMHVDLPVEPLAQRRGDAVDPALESLVLRALAKEPAARHASAAAFRYELNTVMEMLDLVRRRRTGPIQRVDASAVDAGTRDARLVAAFEHSPLPQATITVSGEITAANRAFGELLGHRDGVDPPLEGQDVAASSLGAFVPRLVRAAQAAHAAQRTSELRAQVERGPEQPPLGLTIWLLPVPIADGELHVIVRID